MSNWDWSQSDIGTDPNVHWRAGVSLLWPKLVTAGAWQLWPSMWQKKVWVPSKKSKFLKKFLWNWSRFQQKNPTGIDSNAQLGLIPIGHWDQSQWDQSQCPIGIDPNWTLGSIPMSNWDQSQLDIGTWKYDLNNLYFLVNLLKKNLAWRWKN